MTTRNVAAVDLGAESGRVMLARFDGHQVQIEEVYRFPNRPVSVHGHRFWNILGIWEDVLTGLGRARVLAGNLDSVGVDSWGVDYGLVDDHGLLIGQPYHYRDTRTDGVQQEVGARIPRATIYRQTGIQFLPFNTLYQLVAQQRQQPWSFLAAQRLLLIPDLLHSWLCGEQMSERTNATTTQFWDAETNQWAMDLLTALDLPSHFLPAVLAPGTLLGPVLPALRGVVGTAQVAVPTTHDTAAAIAAIPVQPGTQWGYISLGTWSLVGQELDRPLRNDAALAANFTNEGGMFETTRFLKNVMGLWILQECQRIWREQGLSFDYSMLFQLAAATPAFAAVIDPDDPSFLAPSDMVATINAYLAAHGQSPLESPAQLTRCILESLVMRSVQVLHECMRLTGQPIAVLHIVGGGSRNPLLNQWFADAMGVPVVAGPIEATSRGNALLQLVALGDLHTFADVRALARQESPQTFAPQTGAQTQWRNHIDRLARLSAERAE
jgi:rhamnulokinase